MKKASWALSYNIGSLQVGELFPDVFSYVAVTLSLSVRISRAHSQDDVDQNFSDNPRYKLQIFTPINMAPAPRVKVMGWRTFPCRPDIL